MRQTIVQLRNRLIAEHLDTSPDRFAKTLEHAGGSLIAAIEQLNTAPRGLRAFKAMADEGPDVPAPGTGLGYDRRGTTATVKALGEGEG